MSFRGKFSTKHYKLDHHTSKSSNPSSPTIPISSPPKKMADKQQQQYIVMFPYMAQGHIIPFLALAKLISKRYPTYTVTFVSTPLNIQNLRSSLIPRNSNIHLQSIPFRSSEHGLPPGAENTDTLSSPSQWLQLFQASTTLESGFARLLWDLKQQHGQPPLLIVADVMLGWTVEIARELNIFHASFTTCGAFGTAVYFSLWLNLTHIHTDLPEFGLPGFPETFTIHRNQLSSYLKVADGNDPWSRFFGGQIARSMKSNAMLCNTVEEVEMEGLRLLRQNTGLKVWTVGPLLPLDSNSSHSRVGNKVGMEVEQVTKWLDYHQPGSVVHVSFGSQNSVSPIQMKGLASGLEASGHPFIWSIRPPIGSDLNSDISPEWLPDGFETRMKENKKGLLIKRWAPQLEILSHKSTGAFLSHCGWNSTLESLSRGVVMIGWPLASEQFYNSKMIEEELGVGMEVARGVVEEVRMEEVVRVIRLVMEGEKGKEMKEKVTRLKEKIREAVKDGEGEGKGKGSSIRAVDEFIEMAKKFIVGEDKC